MVTEVPTLAQQVSRLYEIIAGYHGTHLLEIGRAVGFWEAITAVPGLTADGPALRSDLGNAPGHFLPRPRGTSAHAGWRGLSRLRSALSRCVARALSGAWRRLYARDRRGFKDTSPHLP